MGISDEAICTKHKDDQVASVLGRVLVVIEEGLASEELLNGRQGLDALAARQLLDCHPGSVGSHVAAAAGPSVYTSLALILPLAWVREQWVAISFGPHLVRERIENAAKR